MASPVIPLRSKDLYAQCVAIYCMCPLYTKHLPTPPTEGLCLECPFRTCPQPPVAAVILLDHVLFPSWQSRNTSSLLLAPSCTGKSPNLITFSSPFIFTMQLTLFSWQVTMVSYHWILCALDEACNFCLPLLPNIIFCVTNMKSPSKHSLLSRYLK